MANTGRQKDERTLQFMQHFMEEHEKGLSILEIADKYLISRRNAYNLLQEIADENGVTRDELLYRPHSLHTKPLFVHRDGEEKVNVEEIRKEFQNIHTSACKIIDNIDKVLEEDVQ